MHNPHTHKGAKPFLQVSLALLTLLMTSNLPAFSQGFTGPHRGRGALPPCTLDSFVDQAGVHKFEIYGDEGTNGLPPIMGFHKENRINAGITGQRDAGLTTGHGSRMPDAWGADEWIVPGGEWGQSGASGQAQGNNNADQYSALAEALRIAQLLGLPVAGNQPLAPDLQTLPYSPVAPAFPGQPGAPDNGITMPAWNTNQDGSDVPGVIVN